MPGALATMVSGSAPCSVSWEISIFFLWQFCFFHGIKETSEQVVAAWVKALSGTTGGARSWELPDQGLLT
jgi:hypothetical protein